jgi:predicted glycoside hydrolase/deacetylase ChbG (UPF0249 family)
LKGPALIIHADDLGISAGVNRAIFDAHVNGVVTSASLLMGGEQIEAALRELKAHPLLDTGVHLCLHDERPVATPASIPSLLGESGRLLPLGQVIKRIATGVIRSAQIEAEYEAQVARAHDHGLRVTHLDSHCHLHAFPPVALAATRIAHRFGIKCLRKPEALRISDYSGAPPRRYFLSSAITACSLVSSCFYSRGLRAPDRFIGLVHSGGGDATWILNAMRGLAAGTVSEIMVHPGDGSDYGGGTENNHGHWQRRAEYDLLISDQLRNEIDAHQIRLINYREFGGSTHD